MSQATNIGGVVSSINALVNAANGSTPVLIGVLPAGAVIRRIDTDVSTAFNGASGSISVGVSSSLAEFVSSGSVTASGRTSATWNTQWNTQSAVSDTSVYATYSGAASTSGSAQVSIDYVSQSML
jgi:hypothetical protein